MSVGFAAIDVLVRLKVSCNDFRLHGSDLMDMCLGCLFHDFVYADLVVYIAAVERAL